MTSAQLFTGVDCKKNGRLTGDAKNAARLFFNDHKKNSKIFSSNYEDQPVELRNDRDCVRALEEHLYLYGVTTDPWRLRLTWRVETKDRISGFFVIVVAVRPSFDEMFWDAWKKKILATSATDGRFEEHAVAAWVSEKSRPLVEDIISHEDYEGLKGYTTDYWIESVLDKTLGDLGLTYIESAPASFEAPDIEIENEFKRQEDERERLLRRDEAAVKFMEELANIEERAEKVEFEKSKRKITRQNELKRIMYERILAQKRFELELYEIEIKIGKVVEGSNELLLLRKNVNCLTGEISKLLVTINSLRNQKSNSVGALILILVLAYLAIYATVSTHQRSFLPLEASTSEKAATLVSKGIKAYECGDFLTAIDLATRTLKLEPGNEDASNLLNKAKIDQLLKEGREACENGDFITAKIKASAALEINAANENALELLSEAKRENAKKNVAEGEVLFEAGRFEEAEEKAKQALEDDPDNRAAIDLGKNAKIAKLLKKCRENLENEYFAGAKKIASEILKIDPKNGEATTLLSEAKKKNAKSLASEGEESRKGRELEEAKRIVEEALADDPECQEAIDLRSRIDRDSKVVVSIEEGKEALSKCNYQLAKDKARAASELDKDKLYEEDAKKLLDDAKCANATALAEEGDQFRRERKLDAANEKLKEALAENPNCIEAKDLQSNIERDRRVVALLNEAVSAFENNDLELAQEKVNAASELDEDNLYKNDAQELLGKIEIAALLQEGWRAFEDGDYPLAIEKAREVFERDRNNENAGTLLKKALTENANRLVAEGNALLEKNEFDEAESKADEALENDPACKGASDLKENIVKTRIPSWIEDSTRPAGTRNVLTIVGKKYEFVWGPGGVFEIGSKESEDGRTSDETLHEVQISSGRWMLSTETTQAMYFDVMGSNPSVFQGDDLPVTNVTYDDALAFCKALEKKLPKYLKLVVDLPTEAEWEIIARAGSTSAYPWGDEESNIAKMANCSDAGRGRATPGGTYPPNEWGVFDMIGNVREWVKDRFGDYAEGVLVNPKGPSDGAQRVVRGGSYNSGATLCRPASRSAAKPETSAADLGFRIVLTVAE